MQIYPFDVIKSIGNNNDCINISKQMASTTRIKIITTSPKTYEASAHKLIKATATATATLNLTKQEISKIL